MAIGSKRLRTKARTSRHCSEPPPNPGPSHTLGMTGFRHSCLMPHARSPLREQREPDHLVQQPRADVGVPLRFTRSHFAEVEADDALAGADEGAEKADRFVP